MTETMKKRVRVRACPHGVAKIGSVSDREAEKSLTGGKPFPPARSPEQNDERNGFLK